MKMIAGAFLLALAVQTSVTSSLIEGVEPFFAKHPENDRFLYFTMGNEGGAMLSGAWAFAAALQDHAVVTNLDTAVEP